MSKFFFSDLQATVMCSKFATGLTFLQLMETLEEYYDEMPVKGKKKPFIELSDLEFAELLRTYAKETQ